VFSSSPQILLLRHGHRLDFIQPQWFETAAYPYDPPLSALGWQQALELVAQLREFPIQQIFSSPYQRALQTAHPIAQHLGLRPTVENGLKEWLNIDWSPDLPLTLPAAENPLPVPIAPHHNSYWHPQYPETEEELCLRADLMLEKLIIDSKTCSLIVAHKHILLAMVNILTGQPFGADLMTPATVILLTAENPLRGSWKIRPL
jgi:broad specificity phosphatase PhoE